jgi:hypothetical protein
MPNYVYNQLTILGNNIDNFYNANKPKLCEHKNELELSFHMLVPEPNNSDWYKWRCDNWGCKWDASNVSYKMINNNKSEYTFSTPWNYPLAWLKTVSKIYPTLIFHIKYEDDGFNFFGTSIIKNGIERQVETYNYSDIITYLTVAGDCDMDDLLAIAKKYNYTCSGQCEEYDEFLNELEEYIQEKYFKYGFCSSLFENIIINLLENKSSEEENTENESDK